MWGIISSLHLCGDIKRSETITGESRRPRCDSVNAPHVSLTLQQDNEIACAATFCPITADDSLISEREEGT